MTNRELYGTGSRTDILHRNVSKFLAGWFGPAHVDCPMCGRRCRDGVRTGADLVLCGRCYADIPWIERPQCETCGRSAHCPDCRRGIPRRFVCNRAAVRYSPEMKRWLARYKFRGDERLAALFGWMLKIAFERHYAGLDVSAVAFVPVGAERLLERGFDQTERMAAWFARSAGLPLVSLLVRVRDVGKQSVRTRRERLAVVGGRFAARPDAVLEDRTTSKTRPAVLLVDDVYTTGSTLDECAAAIRARWAVDVYGLTWAR